MKGKSVSKIKVFDFGTQVFRVRSSRTRLAYAYEECAGYKL